MLVLIPADSHSLPVTLVCLLGLVNDSLVLSASGGAGAGGGTGEALLCFIASHCQEGRLRPSSLLLIGFSELFLL